MKTVYVLGIITLFLGVFSHAFAQNSLTNTQLAITLSPTTPEAGEQVKAYLQTHTLSGVPQSIVWTVNGETMASANNQNTLLFTAGSAGTETTIRATVTMRDGVTHTASTSFTINQLDVIIDSDTTVPGFFAGRPEPSIGSRVKLTALLSGATPQNYTYAWKLNDTVINGGPVRGGYTQIITMPLGRRATVSVEVSNANNVLVASKRIQIEASEPEIIFYEDNPLRGLLPKALVDRSVITSQEITLRGEPYFLSKDIPSGDIYREWSINNRTVTTRNQNQNTITLEKSQSNRFQIGFHIRNLKQVLQGASDSVQLSF